MASTAKFEALFNQSNLLAAILDLDGNLREINGFAVDWCGYKRDEVLNQLFWDTPWWRGSEEVKSQLRRAVQQALEGNVVRDEISYWVADGSERIASISVQPIRDSAGTVIFLNPTGVDITEQKRLEDALRQSEATFRAMFSISSVGKVQAEPEGGSVSV